jgi:hypothetical protein
VNLFDTNGSLERLQEIRPGVFETPANGIRGVPGHAYFLEVTFYDGRKYRSLPDTLSTSGAVERVSFEFNGKGNSPNIYTKSPYGFDLFADANSGTHDARLFLWTTEAVFRADTQPGVSKSACNPNDRGVCNFAPLCSGLLNIGTNQFPNMEQVAPCSCCTCWYSIFNPAVKLTSNQLGLRDQQVMFKKENVFRLPLGPWIFQHKVIATVTLKAISRQTERFWHAIQDQQTAVGSLFQPVTGRIPTMFEQLKGPPIPVVGIFYASGESSLRIEITPDDIPDKSVVPVANLSASAVPCLEFYPNGSTTKPSYWKD